MSVVIPVYKGATTLPQVVAELAPLQAGFETPDGSQARLSEVLLVHDHGPDDSAAVMRALQERYPWVRTLWLSRNYGQHPATLAGMASSGGDWVVTMDEDGQHDPAYIGAMLDVALREQSAVVYALPLNAAPHGALRNLASKTAKRIVAVGVGQKDVGAFQSFRLILGEAARSTAAYAGAGVYLDVALGWVAGAPAQCGVMSREEGGRSSGYSTRRLLSHFWRMVLSSGTRGLRIVSALGVTFAGVGLVWAIALAISRLAGGSLPAGWTSIIVVVLVGTGAVLFSLGVIAEYLGVAVNLALGKPPYLLVSDPGAGPLGHRPATR
ncbi:glycosyltransferase [Cellulomonas rhizosphaerae]|uniref:Glycosyltransferase n=1 Tax=Cellulomonas rhizosphaerae TaxID=2293719 RepID=A0A413RJT9_9CELL|nr:glycosyltransferase [Cellulomonas rhizosphaerae]